jgi:hypothetical protein
MRRWMKFQKSMNKKRWLEADREWNGPITLFDFANRDDAVDAALVDEGDKKGGWRISDDSVIGGFSKGKMELIRTSDDYKRHMRGESPVNFLEQLHQQEATTAVEESEELTTDFTPFIRWKGTIDTKVDEKSDFHRSGFCAIRSPEFPFGGCDLGGRYNGLEIMCRSDGRHYSLMLKCESMVPDDIYQCFISIPPTIPPGSEICQETGGKFNRSVLLFQHFIVTSAGRMRAKQRELDNSIKVQSIGLTLMDGSDGDFQFDLARIRAVNYDETGVIGDVD